MLMSKLKEALICFRAGTVTLPYPFQPADPAPGFRGKVTLDAGKCIGCGACANACPPRVISLTDDGDERTFFLTMERCTYCARCQEICPEKAIGLSQEFELATNDKHDLTITFRLRLARCSRCGSRFTTERIVRKLEAEAPNLIGVPAGGLRWLEMCPDCRMVQEGYKMGVEAARGDLVHGVDTR